MFSDTSQSFRVMWRHLFCPDCYGVAINNMQSCRRVWASRHEHADKQGCLAIQWLLWNSSGSLQRFSCLHSFLFYFTVLPQKIAAIHQIYIFYSHKNPRKGVVLCLKGVVNNRGSTENTFKKKTGFVSLK